MYEVKEYMGNYNKEQFYAIMGRFFAERVYRKKLPYLCNERDKIWYLFYRAKDLVGFCAIKPLENYTLISDIYVLDQFKDANVFEFMAKYITNHYAKNDLQILTNSDREKDIWEFLDFKVVNRRGTYMICRREKVDERNQVSSS
ncbi:MAG: hypothetical protein V8Q75_01065 [Bacilli bacterium]